MMARVGIVVGLLLCSLTVAAMLATNEKYVSQFVPMMFGIPLLFLGVVSLNPHRRLRAIPIAGLLAAIGILLSGVWAGYGVWLWLRGRDVPLLSIQTLSAMSVTCSIFGLGVLAWVRQRRQRSRRAEPVTGSDSPAAEEPAETMASSDHEPGEWDPVDPEPPDESLNPYQPPATPRSLSDH